MATKKNVHAKNNREVRVRTVRYLEVEVESSTRPSALGMSDPIWGPLIHILVDEKKKCEGLGF